MSEIHNQLSHIEATGNVEKQTIVADILGTMESLGYDTLKIDHDKPWGTSFKIDNDQVAAFISYFFPEAIKEPENQIGGAGVSLLVPSGRMSWQYHERRVKYWSFLTIGAYNKGYTDDPGQISIAHVGDIVRIDPHEHHRLVGRPGGYTIVAETWGHADASDPSDRYDIIRLQDDYGRQL